MPNLISSDNNLRLSASVCGLGPLFKIKLNVENLGNEPLKDLFITYTYDL